jgi:hypothetical protein
VNIFYVKHAEGKLGAVAAVHTFVDCLVFHPSHSPRKGNPQAGKSLNLKFLPPFFRVENASFQ